MLNNCEIKSKKLIVDSQKIGLQYWEDLWAYRELFYMLAWRDVLVRYKQTVIGIAWALVRPVLTTVVFVVIFGRVAKLPTEGTAPYAILVYAAMLPWQFFATSLVECSNSLITNTNLVSKVFFPRLILPASSIITAFLDFIIASVVLVFLMAWYNWWSDWRLIFVPFFMLFAFLATVGPGLWLAALNVQYRDFRYLVPFVVQFGLYVSPVGFSSGVVPEKWRLLYSLNPMVGVIDCFRWAVLRGETPLDMRCIWISGGMAVFVLVSGVFYFRRVEINFADVI